MPGKGSVIGDAIVKHPLVKKVSFTGGTTTGRALARLAADKLMPVTLELGGKSPTIVFDDADLDHAVNGVLYGIFSSSGESCIAGSRLFVQRVDPRRNSSTGSWRRRTTLRVGDPRGSAHADGPADHRQTPRVDRALRRSSAWTRAASSSPAASVRRAGSTTAAGSTGRRSSTGLAQRRAHRAGRDLRSGAGRRCPFATRPTSLAQANDSVFGLAAGIWTRDYKRAWRTARALETGTVWINTYKQFSISTPFTGIKESGLGIEKGRLGILQYKHQKSLYWGLNEQPLAWAD